ncbi:MAG: SH3 domain-containing protein [Oscillatoriales cyanobacterium RM2_1_1]|nr:SH3 domain-containing protein [Oscillatoriales cyanobacterium RM2_1_1]
MTFKPNQWMIAGIAGVTTAAIIAYTTVQARLSEPGSSPVAPVTETRPEPRPAVKPPIPAVPTDTSSPPPDVPNPPAISPIPNPPTANPPTATPAPEASPVVIRPMTEGCSISMAIVADTEPPLNVRSAPQVAEGNIVGQLDNQTFVSVEAEKEGWLKINSPVEGWISKSRTQSSCPNMERPIQFLPGGKSALVKGQIIGGGSHRYTLNAEAGQTLTVESYQPVFPMIVTPDGKALNEISGAPGTQTEWTGQIPTSGKYTIELDSNFRGYDYEFLVEVD